MKFHFSFLGMFAGAVAQDVFLAQQSPATTVQATGGIPCIACGVLGTMCIDNEPLRNKVKDALHSYCNGKLACDVAVELFVDLLLKGLNPDSICKTVSLCDGSCALFGKGEWPASVPTLTPDDPSNTGRRLTGALTPEQATELRMAMTFLASGDDSTKSVGGLTPVLANLLVRLSGGQSLEERLQAAAKQSATELTDSHPCALTNVTCLINRFTDQHLPIFDADADAFGPTTARGLRGSHWRGADCDDRRDDVYPGRRTSDGDKSVDHDCNGISGGNSSGSYEELFCSAVPRRGLVHIGDSATAHFHLPNQWLTINDKRWNLDNLVPDAEDELDTPACAWGTGHHTAAACPFAARPEEEQRLSIAARVRARNRCNHRDFQNIGVNGARVTSAHELVDSMARDPTKDHPALVIFSLIGNDVCNGHEGTSHMTKPEEFKADVLADLAKLDEKLPVGSAVLMIGLVDGRVLFDTMAEIQHPIGSKTKDVYEYLNCNDQTPCKGWLNANETFRNVSTEWAMSLNAQYEAVMSEAHQFKNFELGYFNPPWRAIIDDWVRAGGRAEDVIERVDGFHPSQLGNELLSDAVWEHLETKMPSAIGEVNPHNAEIEVLFGEQGGF